MKASELRVGNIVYYKGKNVVRLDESDFAELIHNGDYFDFLTPVRLGVENLKLFGFEVRCYGGHHYVCGIELGDGGILLYYQDGYWDVVIGASSDEDRNFHVRVDFVHELQNLLYALSKKEI